MQSPTVGITFFDINLNVISYSDQIGKITLS
jgi:hypothetical protein